MRRVLHHPHAPTAAAALLGIAYLLVAPATADMAGATFRSWLWETAGFATWNPQWYGGHHMPGYSLLFGPLAALLGPRLLSVLAGVAAVALFAPLARAVAPTPGAGAWAAWLFVGGALSNVVIGRVPFTLGLASAVAAWACARRPGRGWLATGATAALATVWASPVAGLFLAVAAAGLLVDGGDKGPARALVLGGPAVAGGLLVAWAFPEGGTDRFVASAFWPVLVLSVAGLALLDPRRRGLLAAGTLYLAVLVVAFAIPNPVGQNALRPVLILGPPLLALAARRRPDGLDGARSQALTPLVRRGRLTAGRGLVRSVGARWQALTPAGVVVVAVALVYLQWLPSVRAVAEAHGDPSVSAGFHAELAGFLGPRTQPGERLEVPLTRNHWEAAHLAPVVPLARGWHRQLDRRVAPLFYDDRALTAPAYATWLRENAVRWVALPAGVPFDFASSQEVALLRRGAPFLREVRRTARWTVWEVVGTGPPVVPPARLVARSVDGFELDAPRAGTVVVRERHTPYWSVAGGRGCVRRATGGWTAVRVTRPGRVRVRAPFSLRGALRAYPRCR